MLGLLEIAAGPFVALIGIVAVFIVMRHRSVQTKSMYSARRGQIERKVRAARQRTLAPGSKHAEKEAEQTFAAPGMEAKTAAPTATWGPTAAGPGLAPPPSAELTWDAGPAVAPAPPPFAPSEPAYTPPAPPPPAPEEEWVPAAAQPYERGPEPTAAPIEPPVSTPAGAGAAWSIVGDSKEATAEHESGKKKSKKDKEREKQAEGAPWQLSTGLMPGDEAGEEIKRPSAAIAIAQYAVLVVGLVMVLIGVVVMVANSHVT
jgi:hypothetical protein